MSTNPFRIYTENYRNNLPSGVTFDAATANYFFNGKRFPAIFLVELYRIYVEKTFSFDLPNWFMETGVWNDAGEWYDTISWD